MSSERGRRPRVLWITEEVPDRSLGGGNIRQAHLIRGLGRRCDVVLLVAGTVTDPGVTGSVAELIEVPAPPTARPQGKLARRVDDLRLALLARGSREVAVTAGRRRHLAGRLAELERRSDVVVACHLGTAVLRPARPSARWVAQLHHVSSAKAAQERSIAAGRRQRWLLRREELKAARVERWILRSFDACITVSPRDAELLRGGTASAAEVFVAPNGVDTSRYTPTPLPDTPVILMAGSFQYGPNVDGAQWFCHDVLPLVQRAVPDATLRLVGREPCAEVRALAARKGVSVHADVPSMVPWFEEARLSVVPLRVGTGTRLKALESMAAGRPVVGTTVGLEGLGLLDQVHARIVDEPAAMAGSIVELLTDAGSATAMVRSARELVESAYDWSAIASDLAERLVEVAR